MYALPGFCRVTSSLWCGWHIIDDLYRNIFSFAIPEITTGMEQPEGNIISQGIPWVNLTNSMSTSYTLKIVSRWMLLLEWFWVEWIEKHHNELVITVGRADFTWNWTRFSRIEQPFKMIGGIIWNVTGLNFSKLPKMFHGIENSSVAVTEWFNKNVKCWQIYKFRTLIYFE
jgi:hypothetical protein